MMYSIVLLGHIIVACLTLGAIACSAYVLVQSRTSLYIKLAAAIGVLALLEVVSGFALAMLSPTLSVLEVGSHLVWYLSLCLAAEAALMFKIRTVWTS